MNLDEKRAKYQKLCHAMQSGVAYKMQRDGKETEPKHLRVGVNAAMSNHGALVNLLMIKGVITEDEYYDAMIEVMEREVESYQLELEEMFGAKITLL